MWGDGAIGVLTKLTKDSDRENPIWCTMRYAEAVNKMRLFIIYSQSAIFSQSYIWRKLFGASRMVIHTYLTLECCQLKYLILNAKQLILDRDETIY